MKGSDLDPEFLIGAGDMGKLVSPASLVAQVRANKERAQVPSSSPEPEAPSVEETPSTFPLTVIVLSPSSPTAPEVFLVNELEDWKNLMAFHTALKELTDETN